MIRSPFTKPGPVLFMGRDKSNNLMVNMPSDLSNMLISLLDFCSMFQRKVVFRVKDSEYACTNTNVLAPLSLFADIFYSRLFKVSNQLI